MTKSITLTSQGVSLSCYKWLPQRLACRGWEISHGVACGRLSVNCHRGLSSIFISSSGIGDAAKSENALGNEKPAGGHFNDPAWFDRDSWAATLSSESERRDAQRWRRAALAGGCRECEVIGRLLLQRHQHLHKNSNERRVSQLSSLSVEMQFLYCIADWWKAISPLISQSIGRKLTINLITEYWSNPFIKKNGRQFFLLKESWIYLFSLITTVRDN